MFQPYLPGFDRSERLVCQAKGLSTALAGGRFPAVLGPGGVRRTRSAPFRALRSDRRRPFIRLALRASAAPQGLTDKTL